MVSHRSGETEDNFIGDLVSNKYIEGRWFGNWINQDWSSLQIRKNS